MGNDLQIATTKEFNNVLCDFYLNEDNEMLMTRNQIGESLGYSEPRKAIEKIHNRHSDRLDKFSAVTKLGTSQGTQETYFYNEKGIFEICRWSRQTKANEFMDWVYEIVSAYRQGKLSTNNLNNINQDDLIKMNEILLEAQETTNKLLVDIKSLLQMQTPPPIITDWKTKINTKVRTISKSQYLNPNQILSNIYRELKSEYGHDLNRIKRHYLQETSQVNISTLDLIEINEDIKVDFEYLLEQELLLFDDEDTGQAPNQPTVIDPIRSTIEPLAKLLNDNSIGYNLTYRKVYAAMDVDWGRRQTRYKNAHINKNKPSKFKLLEVDRKLFKLYVETINKMLQEINGEP